MQSCYLVINWWLLTKKYVSWTFFRVLERIFEKNVFKSEFFKPWIWTLIQGRRMYPGGPKTCPYYELNPYKFSDRQLKIWIFGNCYCSKIRKSNFKTLKNHIALVFCAIQKSFCTHLEEGPKIIRTNFEVCNSKDVGIIHISAQNFIIQHTFKNHCFGG